MAYEEYNQKLIKLEREQISMGGNPEYEYYDQGNNNNYVANNVIQQEINRDYEGVKGNIFI